MKKIILSAFSIIAIGSIVFISCAKKTDDNAITPTYAVDGAGTGANPNTTNVTTTGTISTTSVANQNSSMTGIGTTGVWSNVNCSTPTAPTCLTSSNSSLGTNISICFNGAVTAGTYQLIANPTGIPVGKACLTISNPTQQPTGTTWYSSGGTVTVTLSGTAYTAIFNGITCYQAGSIFPAVTVSGQVGCL
jgi:hypothetical protein